MGEDDLAGLETGLVDDVALSGQGEPDGQVGRVLIIVILEKVALSGLGSLFLGGLFDVSQKGFGGFKGLNGGLAVPLRKDIWE